jgi:hypothetical protein
MTFAVTAVIYIAGLYIDDRPVVIVFAASGKDIISLCVAFVGMKTDLASGINGRVSEDTSLVLHLFRTVQKASYSDLSDSVKGCRLGDAFLIFASAYHAITLLLLSVYCSVCEVYYN